MRSDPTAIVALVNTEGVRYSAEHVVDADGIGHWFSLDDEVFSVVKVPALRMRVGPYSRLVGATVDDNPDSETYRCVQTAEGLVLQVVQSGNYVTLAAP